MIYGHTITKFGLLLSMIECGVTQSLQAVLPDFQEANVTEPRMCERSKVKAYMQAHTRAC